MKDIFLVSFEYINVCVLLTNKAHQRTMLVALFMLIMCTCNHNMYSQVIQKGRVVLMSSGKTQVGGVQIMAIGASPTDSDKEGNFELNFPEALPGDPLMNLKIHKKGYEIVNADKLSNWNLTDDHMLNIVVGITNQLDSLRRIYYNLGQSNFHKKYLVAIKQLELLKKEGQNNQVLYRSKLDSLNNELSTYQKKLETYSYRFARIDRDNILEHEKHAIKLLDDGDIEGAIKIYEDMELENLLLNKLTIKNENQEDLALLIPLILNKFLLHSKNKDLVACDSLQKIILDGANNIESKITVVKHYVSIGNKEMTQKIFNRLLNECSSLNDVLLLERYYTELVLQQKKDSKGKAINEEPILNRINDRKDFFSIQEKYLK